MENWPVTGSELEHWPVPAGELTCHSLRTLPYLLVLTYSPVYWLAVSGEVLTCPNWKYWSVAPGLNSNNWCSDLSSHNRTDMSRLVSPSCNIDLSQPEYGPITAGALTHATFIMNLSHNWSIGKFQLEHILSRLEYWPVPVRLPTCPSWPLTCPRWPLTCPSWPLTCPSWPLTCPSLSSYLSQLEFQPWKWMK